jgi:hypothetical protein
VHEHDRWFVAGALLDVDPVAVVVGNELARHRIILSEPVALRQFSLGANRSDTDDDHFTTR